MTRAKQAEPLLKLSDEKLTEKFLKQRGFKAVLYRDDGRKSYYLTDKDKTFEYSYIDGSTAKECWADAPSVLSQLWQNELYEELVNAGYNIGTYPEKGKIITRIWEQRDTPYDIIEVVGRKDACNHSGPVGQALDSLRRALAIASIIRDKELSK